MLLFSLAITATDFTNPSTSHASNSPRLPSAKGILQSQNEAHPMSNYQDPVHTPVSFFFLFESFISPIWAISV